MRDGETVIPSCGVGLGYNYSPREELCACAVVEGVGVRGHTAMITITHDS